MGLTIFQLTTSYEVDSDRSISDDQESHFNSRPLTRSTIMSNMSANIAGSISTHDLLRGRLGNVNDVSSEEVYFNSRPLTRSTETIMSNMSANVISTHDLLRGRLPFHCGYRSVMYISTHDLLRGRLAIVFANAENTVFQLTTSYEVDYYIIKIPYMRIYFNSRPLTRSTYRRMLLRNNLYISTHDLLRGRLALSSMVEKEKAFQLTTSYEVD